LYILFLISLGQCNVQQATSPPMALLVVLTIAAPFNFRYALHPAETVEGVCGDPTSYSAVLEIYLLYVVLHV